MDDEKLIEAAARAMAVAVGCMPHQWPDFFDDASPVLAAIGPALRDMALEEAAVAAYESPAYVTFKNGEVAEDSDGRLMPGSPYDRGRYDAAAAIRALKGSAA